MKSANKQRLAQLQEALTGLIDHVRRGLIDSERRLLFIHTGGLPALFAYAESLGLGG